MASKTEIIFCVPAFHSNLWKTFCMNSVGNTENIRQVLIQQWLHLQVKKKKLAY